MYLPGSQDTLMRKKVRKKGTDHVFLDCLLFFFNLGNNIIIKIKDVIALLDKEGWCLTRTKGSHRQFKHPSIRGVVTIAGKLSDDLAPGTLNSILKQARLK